MMTYEELRARLQVFKDAEADKGERMFLGTPDRWFDDPHWRCVNDHVSTFYLKEEATGNALCLEAGCLQPLAMTFPEDKDGPLHGAYDVDALYKRIAELELEAADAIIERTRFRLMIVRELDRINREFCGACGNNRGLVSRLSNDVRGSLYVEYDPEVDGVREKLKAAINALEMVKRDSDAGDHCPPMQLNPDTVAAMLEVLKNK